MTDSPSLVGLSLKQPAWPLASFFGGVVFPLLDRTCAPSVGAPHAPSLLQVVIHNSPCCLFDLSAGRDKSCWKALSKCKSPTPLCLWRNHCLALCPQAQPGLSLRELGFSSPRTLNKASDASPARVLGV